MIPGFIQAQTHWENRPDMVEDCTDDCGECVECLAIAAETEAEDLAERKGDW